MASLEELEPERVLWKAHRQKRVAERDDAEVEEVLVTASGSTP